MMVEAGPAAAPGGEEADTTRTGDDVAVVDPTASHALVAAGLALAVGAVQAAVQHDPKPPGPQLLSCLRRRKGVLCVFWKTLRTA